MFKGQERWISLFKKEELEFALPMIFCFIQVLKELFGTWQHWWGQIFTHPIDSTFNLRHAETWSYTIIWHPLAQSSWLMKIYTTNTKVMFEHRLMISMSINTVYFWYYVYSFNKYLLETGAYYIQWSKSERETPIQYINTYTWNLERWLTATLYARQQKRHRCKEQTFALYGRRQGWDDLRE